MLKISMLAAAAIALSGCGGNMAAFTGTGDNTASVLGNLQGCHRIYKGSISAGLGAGATGSFDIDCPARPPVVASPVTIGGEVVAPAMATDAGPLRQ